MLPEESTLQPVTVQITNTITKELVKNVVINVKFVTTPHKIVPEKTNVLETESTNQPVTVQLDSMMTEATQNVQNVPVTVLLVKPVVVLLVLVLESKSHLVSVQMVSMKRKP